MYQKPTFVLIAFMSCETLVALCSLVTLESSFTSSFFLHFFFVCPQIRKKKVKLEFFYFYFFHWSAWHSKGERASCFHFACYTLSRGFCHLCLQKGKWLKVIAHLQQHSCDLDKTTRYSVYLKDKERYFFYQHWPP